MTETTDEYRSTEAQAIADLARNEVALHYVDLIDDDGETLRRVVFHRDGRLVDEVDLERHRDHPRRPRGDVQVHTPAGLFAYASRHVIQHESTLWGDSNTRTVTVIFNDHGSHDADNRPGWGDHRAVLQLQHSPEWKAWQQINGQDLSQVQLAEFLEEHLDDIAEPDGATMLEVARTFHATTGVTFKSAVALQSGEQQLVYEENVDAKAGASGSAEIPREFAVQLAPFVGTDPVRVEGRFRFRVREGRLTLGVRLLNLEDIVRHAVEVVVDEVGHELDLKPIAGSAPSALR